MSSVDRVGDDDVCVIVVRESTYVSGHLTGRNALRSFLKFQNLRIDVLTSIGYDDIRIERTFLLSLQFLCLALSGHLYCTESFLTLEHHSVTAGSTLDKNARGFGFGSRCRNSYSRKFH